MVNPTFPVFSGTGTVSWRRGSVRLTASIFWRCCCCYPPQLSLSVLSSTDFLFSVSLVKKKKVPSRRQTSGLHARPWGRLPLVHIVPLALLPVVSEEAASDEGRFRDTPPNAGRLRAPLSPKPNGPFSEHFPINTTTSSSTFSLFRERGREAPQSEKMG